MQNKVEGRIIANEEIKKNIKRSRGRAQNEEEVETQTSRGGGSRERTRKGPLVGARVKEGRAIYESIRWRRA